MYCLTVVFNNRKVREGALKQWKACKAVWVRPCKHLKFASNDR